MNNTLSIIGIIVSAVFGLLGILVAIRKRKYPGSLTYIHDQSVSLVDDLSKKLPNLDIRYKDKEINENIVLLSAYIVNSGSLDLNPDTEEHPLSLRLPENCEILEINIPSKAKNLNISYNIKSGNTVEFRYGLFRCKESFSIQLLAMVKDVQEGRKAKEELEKLEWEHRIANFGQIKKTYIPFRSGRSMYYTIFRKFIAYAIALFYISFPTYTIIQTRLSSEHPVIYFTSEKPAEEETFLITPKRDGTVEVENIKTKTVTNTHLEEFIKNRNLKPIQSMKETSILPLYFTISFFFSGGFIIIYFFGRRDYLSYKTKRLIQACQQEI